MLTRIYNLYNSVIRIIRQKWELNKVLKHQNQIYIGGPTSLSKNTELGKNPNFNGMKILGFGNVKIGDNFHSGTNCEIITSYHNYDKGNKIPYDSTYITKNVIIENNVWLGNNVTILAGVRIGEGAIIQACSMVHKDIPKYAIVGGNPAKVFKYRDKNHYELLKSKKQYH